MSTMTTPSPSSVQTSSSAGASGGVPEVSPRQAREWQTNSRAVVIDVREPDEHAHEHIQGAVLVPLSRFDPSRVAAAAKLAGVQSVVLHCKGGKRSADACRLSAALAGPGSGLTVVSLAGGIEAWKRDGLPVEIDARVSGMSVMRQVQLIIGSFVLAGSALAWFVDPMFLGVPAFFGAGLFFAGATGTCALATLVGKLPWNRGAAPCAGCSTDTCAGPANNHR